MSTVLPPVRTELLRDGAWIPSASGDTYAVLDPATEAHVADVAVATPGDVDAAVESTVRGFRTWRSTDAWTRSAVLRRAADLVRERADQIALVMTTEQGKPLAESRAETLATADQYDWYADEARRLYGRIVDGHGPGSRIFVRREPVGVVAAFSTWNFPALLASRKIAPALAAGCAVVVVPAEETPLTTLLLVQALLDAGLPDGVIATLTGEVPSISDQLVSHPDVRKISLTGSVPVGQAVLRAAAEGIKDVALELGGHAPVLVFDDADLASAAQACVGAKFRNAGQVCASPSRFYVQASAVDEFTGHFVLAARSLSIGDGRAAGTDVGPLTNARRLSAAERLVDDARAVGAEVLLGGERPDHLAQGHYFRPTVLIDVPDTALVMREEPFAPVAPITPFDALDDVLTRANAVDLGLAGYVFTRDLQTAFDASDGLEVGMVAVNHMAIATAEAPFGGVKRSGFGREGGAEGILDYTTVKYVSMAL